jgi:hypothetical protein
MSDWITVDGKAYNLAAFTHADAKGDSVTLRQVHYAVTVRDADGELRRALGLKSDPPKQAKAKRS